MKENLFYSNAKMIRHFRKIKKANPYVKLMGSY